jgi:hypothetical protein
MTTDGNTAPAHQPQDENPGPEVRAPSEPTNERHDDDSPGFQRVLTQLFPARGPTTEPPNPLDPGQLTSHTGVLRRRQYSVSTLSVLTRRYVKARGDLLVSIDGKSTEGLEGLRGAYAERCSDYLKEAKKQLEFRRANFLVCSSLLFLAEVTLVWLYPPEILELRCQAVHSRLTKLEPRAQYLERALLDAQNDDDRALRSALEDAMSHLQQFEQDAAIGDDLQVTRLRMLMLYIASALLLLLAAVPYVMVDLSQAKISGWPVVTFSNARLTQLISAATVGVIGAVGGILSGLLATRDTATTLLDYRASMLKLGLKPLVGAVAALTLYLLLGWQVLTGVQVTSGGTFLVVGFLAGFSERYFLRLLRAEEEPRDRRRDIRQDNESLQATPSTRNPHTTRDPSSSRP